MSLGLGKSYRKQNELHCSGCLPSGEKQARAISACLPLFPGGHLGGSNINKEEMRGQCEQRGQRCMSLTYWDPGTCPCLSAHETGQIVDGF